MTSRPESGLGENWWYFQELFAYTNRLLERIEQRANFLLVSNSLVGAAYFSILSFFADERHVIARRIGNSSRTIPATIELSTLTIILLLIPALAILASIIFSLLTVLPVVLRSDIKLNHDFIAGMEPDEYYDFVSDRRPTAMRRDFILEIHILSRIINIKSRRVGRSARSFLAAMVMIPPLLAFYFAGLLN